MRSFKEGCQARELGRPDRKSHAEKRNATAIKATSRAFDRGLKNGFDREALKSRGVVEERKNVQLRRTLFRVCEKTSETIEPRPTVTMSLKNVWFSNNIIHVYWSIRLRPGRALRARAGRNRRDGGVRKTRVAPRRGEKSLFSDVFLSGDEAIAPRAKPSTGFARGIARRVTPRTCVLARRTKRNGDRPVYCPSLRHERNITRRRRWTVRSEARSASCAFQ